MNIVYQFFGFILFQIYNLVQNYGLAIVLFTVLWKTILLPLNIKQTKSMREMQALQPELQKLQKKYKNNQEKLQQETMKLYKIYKVNPMAGCLPLLLQLPILWGLYGALRDPGQFVFGGDTSALTHQFLWLKDLSVSDPYYIIPILCVVFTFITQKFTMAAQKGTMNEAAEKSNKMMMYIMPIFIGVCALSLPAGIGIYWVVQNIYTFFQQFFMLRRPVKKLDTQEVERRLAEEKRKEIKEKKEQRKQASQMREEAIAAQMGKNPKKKSDSEEEVKKPLTKPASTKKVKRKTITKIPQRDNSLDEPERK